VRGPKIRSLLGLCVWNGLVTALDGGVFGSICRVAGTLSEACDAVSRDGDPCRDCSHGDTCLEGFGDYVGRAGTERILLLSTKGLAIQLARNSPMPSQSISHIEKRATCRYKGFFRMPCSEMLYSGTS